MTKPVIVASCDDERRFDMLESELRRRYSTDYDVICVRSHAAPTTLERVAGDSRQVVLFLADQHGSGDGWSQLLSAVTDLHPAALRVLLVAPFDAAAANDALRDALRCGQADRWAHMPWRTPDEEFHAAITASLRDWTRSHLPSFEAVRVIAARSEARSHEIRDLFTRNRVPFGFYEESSPEARDALTGAGLSGHQLPVVLVETRALVAPTNAQLAEALGVRTRPTAGSCDLVVIGSGPAGLAASVYAASEGLRTALLEREAIGGQAGTTSMIRNYLGFPSGISGGELTGRAYEQAWQFGAEFVYGNEAVALRVENRRRVVTLADGAEISAAAVVLATGVSYRRLDIPRIEALVGTGVYYGAAVTEAEAMTGRDVFVVGGGNSAGQAAVHLAAYATSVTVLVRGSSLAESMSDYLIDDLRTKPNITVRYGVEVVGATGERRLEGLTLRDHRRGETEEVECAAVFILVGAEPRTQWLPSEIARDRWGYVITGDDLRDGRGFIDSWPLSRNPMVLETSMPGVFAVGDVRHRAVKRVAAAVGEGSIAVRMVHEYLATMT